MGVVVVVCMMAIAVMAAAMVEAMSVMADITGMAVMVAGR